MLKEEAREDIQILPEKYASDTNYTLEKPQKHFEDFIDNSSSLPFIPKLQNHGSRRLVARG